MATMFPFAGLNGDGPQPRLVGAAAQSARPVPAAVTVRRVEPLAPVFLGLHGVMVLVNLGGEPWQFAAVGMLLLLGLVGLGGRGPAWMVTVRGLAVLVVGVALQASAGGAGGWFMAWPFVLVAVYPLALPGPAGLVIAGLAVLGYVLVVRLAHPAVGPALAVGRGVLLAGELSLFRCRYQVPGEGDPFEVTVTPLADGDGAVVTHRPAPEPHGASPVR
jgi:hypothetical protein